MRTILGTMLALCLVLPLAACGSGDKGAEQAEAQTLTGQVWTWQSLTGDESLDVPDPELYSIAFTEGGEYRIRADCNTGGGSYSVEEGKLTVSPGPMTRAACGPMSMGDMFVRLLGQTESFALEPGLLTVDVGEGRSMTFAPLPADAAHGGTEVLAGSEWMVTRYNTGLQSVSSIVGGVELTVAFGEEGTVSGSAGCNSFTGSFAVDGSSVEIGPLAATAKMCIDEAVMEQEGRFLAALNAATTYTILGSQLELRDDAGALQVAGSR